MKGVLAFLIGSLLSPAVAAQTDEQCAKALIWYEARGESIRTMRSVLDVAINRMHKYKMSMCQVVAQRGQFPWYKKGIKKKLAKSFDSVYNDVINTKKVLNSRYLYFNHGTAHSWGKNNIKIGRLYFSV